MHVLAVLLSLVSVLSPVKGWFAGGEPLEVRVKAEGDVTLVLTDFLGKPLEAKGDAGVSGEKSVDLRAVFPVVGTPGTYLLYAVPKGTADKDVATSFQGTPLVVGVRDEKRRGAPAGVAFVKIEPLCYAEMTTDAGAPAALAFYYDVAPNTAANFLSLAQGGYFDGVGFHRIIKDFVIQGGDPRWADPEAAGTGGPGYTITAEFNERPHLPGVLSMARNGDPQESPQQAPRAEFANSAGSQFFVCLNYAQTRQLDRRYTAFGRVVTGMETVNAIAAVPTAPTTDRPTNPPKMTKVEVKPVTKDHNPYAQLQQMLQETAPGK